MKKRKNKIFTNFSFYAFSIAEICENCNVETDGKNGVLIWWFQIGLFSNVV